MAKKYGADDVGVIIRFIGQAKKELNGYRCAGAIFPNDVVVKANGRTDAVLYLKRPDKILIEKGFVWISWWSVTVFFQDDKYSKLEILPVGAWESGDAK